MNFYAELEWWNDESGAEILIRGLRAAGSLIVDESVHVINPDQLTVRPKSDYGCETSLFFTFRSETNIDGAVYYAFRNAGIRLKEVGALPESIPARCAMSDLVAMWRAEAEQWEAEHA